MLSGDWKKQGPDPQALRKAKKWFQKEFRDGAGFERARLGMFPLEKVLTHQFLVVKECKTARVSFAGAWKKRPEWGFCTKVLSYL